MLPTTTTTLQATLLKKTFNRLQNVITHFPFYYKLNFSSINCKFNSLFNRTHKSETHLITHRIHKRTKKKPTTILLHKIFVRKIMQKRKLLCAQVYINNNLNNSDIKNCVFLLFVLLFIEEKKTLSHNSNSCESEFQIFTKAYTQ